MAIVTPLKTAAEQQLVQQYADSKAELPGGPAVRKLREDAFAGFEAKGLPHRRLESWRYTDLRTLLREARPLAGGTAVTAAVKARLAALKLDRDSAYIAALCPGRVPTGLVPAGSEPRLAEIARQHIALAAPKQLWLMGSAVSRAILGMELTQARGTLHKINHENGTVEAVVSFSPRFLLQSPRRKADAWADMQMLIKGNSA